MAKHRAQRNHFLVGCTLSLIAIFGLLSVVAPNLLNTSSVSANVASDISVDTPYHSTLTVAPSTPTSPDTPPKPTAAELRAAAQMAAAQLKAQQDAAAQAAAAAKAAADKAAADKAAAAKAVAEKAAADAAAAKAAAATATPPPPPAPTPAPAAARGSGVAAYQAYAASKVSASEYSCLVPMWNRESGWNPNAQNPSSTAYGIAQFLDSTWAGTGYAKTSDPYTQIDAGIVYVDKAYGGACAAWSFWQAHNYY